MHIIIMLKLERVTPDTVLPLSPVEDCFFVKEINTSSSSYNLSVSLKLVVIIKQIVTWVSSYQFIHASEKSNTEPVATQSRLLALLPPCGWAHNLPSLGCYLSASGSRQGHSMSGGLSKHQVHGLQTVTLSVSSHFSSHDLSSLHLDLF